MYLIVLYVINKGTLAELDIAASKQGNLSTLAILTILVPNQHNVLYKYSINDSIDTTKTTT